MSSSSASSDSAPGPQSLSFDRAAPRYDATRGYPPDVAERIGAAIVEAAAPAADARFLEVGVGTGRIALPIARQGYDYTGVDISEGMVARLQEKVTALQQEADAASPPLRLQVVMADMTALPFADASFDVVVAVHVFHLMSAWKRALDEVLRVLRPGGLFLHCWDDYLDGEAQDVQGRWVDIVQDLGGAPPVLGAQRRSLVTDYLRERGLPVDILRTVEWTTQESPRDAFDYIAQRVWSRTWLVSDAVFAASIQQLESWALHHFGAQYTEPRPLSHQFVISRARR
jgi:ubiquinone/menaquinone biosynthesis C-methylase UbiE